jgi:HSP20 family molecular chaperone IbpA
VAYELHGELPGVDRENLQIEFTDPQTIVIRGRVERTYTAGTPPAVSQEATLAAVEAAEPAAADAIADDYEQVEATNDAASVSHKTTVTDEETETAKEQGTYTEPEVSSQETAKPAEPEAKPAEKYWVSERSIGQFARSFSFPARVEQESVSANLKDGILSVVVPKAKKHEARRINIE